MRGSPPMTKRRTDSPEFKARVAMEAISGRKTLPEIAADHAIHPIQVSQWKKQLLEGAGDIFNKGRKDKEKGCLLYTSPSPRDATLSRMPSSA